MGAPKGNTNRLRHGLTAAALPAGCSHIVKETGKLRHALESAVEASKGTVSLVDLATINRIIRLERHALMAALWLRKAKLEPSQMLEYSREVVTASEARDKAIRQLHIDAATPADAWGDVDAMLAAEAAQMNQPQEGE